MVWVLHHYTIVLLFSVVTIWVLRLLDRSESSLVHFVVLSWVSIVNCVCSTWWNAHWLASSLDIPFSNTLLLYRLLNCLKHCRAIISSITTTTWCILSSCWEKSTLLSLWVFVLSSVKSSIVFLSSCVLGSIGTSSNACYVSGICCITVFSLHWLNYGIIEIDYEIVIDSILIRWFRFSNWMSSSTIVVTSGLSSSMESCNSFIWWSILLIIVLINSSMLDSLVIERISSVLCHCLDWWSYEFIQDFPSIFHLIWMKWSRHVQILFLLLRNNALIWRMVCSTSVLANNFSFIKIITGIWRNISSQSHFLLEINFS